MMNKKYFRYMAPLYIHESGMAENALMCIVSDKNQPDEIEIDEMKADITYLMQKGYVQIKENDNFEREQMIELTGKGKNATIAITDAITDDVHAGLSNVPESKRGIWIALAGIAAIGITLLGVFKFRKKRL